MVEIGEAGRRHRRAVDRRAGHPADDADVPLRRHGVARHRAVQARGEEPGHGQVPERRRPSSARTATSSSSTGTARSRSWTTRGARRSATRSSTARRSRSPDGQEVVPGQELVEWDPFTSAILTEVGGHDRVPRHHGRREPAARRRTGSPDSRRRSSSRRSAREKRSPQVIIQGEGRERKYLLPIGSHLMVADGQEVHPGDVLAKIPRETTKTKDITGGLPRDRRALRGAASEGRRRSSPRSTATVSHGPIAKGMRKVIITGDDGEIREYLIPRYTHVNVQEGERVQRGRSADRRPDQPARHPGDPGREGAAAVPRGQDPGGLPVAERRDQRQAHRGHRPADDAAA